MKIPMRPFRFSVLTTGAGTSQEWIDKVCEAEDLGYHSLLFADHAFNEMAPAPAIAAAAAVTKHLRFGSYMFGNDFRHPLLLAQDAATLDQLSNGRIDLGLGTGYMRDDYQQLGIPLDPPQTRIERLEEAVQIIKGYFAGQAYDFHGKYYQVNVRYISPAPVQKPGIPLLMGGGGKRMIQLAAREADQVSFNPRTTRDGGLDFSSVSPAATDQKLKWFLDAAGNRAKTMEISVLAPCFNVSNQESETVKTLEEFLRNFQVPQGELTIEQLRESPHTFVGSMSEVEEKFLQVRERFGISHFVFFEPLQAGKEVVKRLAGK